MLKFQYVIKLLYFVLSISSLKAFAFTSQGIVFSPMFGLYNYNDNYSEAGAGSDKRSHFLYDIRLGYLLAYKIYIGAIYSSMSRDNNPGTISRDSFGGSIGFSNNNIALLAHLYPFSEYTTGTFKATSGLGYQLDASYFIPVAKVFALGLQFTYRSIAYSKYTPTGGTAIEKRITEVEYLPMIGFAAIL